MCSTWCMIDSDKSRKVARYLFVLVGPDATSSWPDIYTFNPATGMKDVPLKATVNAEFVVRNSIDPDHVWVYVGILLAIIVVVRMLSILALARRAAAFF
eukprot:s4060_g4.t1